jgi:hypothetical protein
MSDILNNNTTGSPEDFDVSFIETENQKFLRYEFSAITAENGTDIDCFDPTAQGQKEATWLRIRTDRMDLEDDERTVSKALLRGMLHTLGLEIPTDRNDERNIFFCRYSNGVAYIIWNVTRYDGVTIPFYTHTKKKDGTIPKFIGMLTYEKAESTRKFFQDYLDANDLLRQQLMMSTDALNRLSTDDRMAIAATYRDIQSL